MKILPMMSRGVVLLHEDGRSYELAPMHVYRDAAGRTVLRLGRNTFVFNEDGTFDGEECDLRAADFADPKRAADFTGEICEALEIAHENTHEEPAYTYFREGEARAADELKSIAALGRNKPEKDCSVVYVAGRPKPVKGRGN